MHQDKEFMKTEVRRLRPVAAAAFAGDDLMMVCYDTVIRSTTKAPSNCPMPLPFAAAAAAAAAAVPCLLAPFLPLAVAASNGLGFWRLPLVLI